MRDFSLLSSLYQPKLWNNILLLPSPNIEYKQYTPPDLKNPYNEVEQTTWLINLFNDVFRSQNIILVHAKNLNKSEPEYFPATTNQPAKICFAHGYFASALHEISHWTIAGNKRRLLNDFGYWYAPDGRNEDQQKSFEKVEIKPQAIECLLTLACNRNFRVSQDNLFANFDTSNSTFESDVYQLAQDFLLTPQKLPRDAQTLLTVLYKLVHN